jgi:hypothetical protein
MADDDDAIVCRRKQALSVPFAQIRRRKAGISIVLQAKAIGLDTASIDYRDTGRRRARSVIGATRA